MLVLDVVIPASGFSQLYPSLTRILGTVRVGAPNTNTADVTLGSADLDFERLMPGDPAVPFSHPNGIDLSRIYVRGTPGDRVRVGHFGEIGSPV